MYIVNLLMNIHERISCFAGIIVYCMRTCSSAAYHIIDAVNGRTLNATRQHSEKIRHNTVTRCSKITINSSDGLS